MPAKLEALVLACLEKDPNRRPQSATELRRQLEACAIAAWTADDARAWWLQHQAALAAEPARSSDSPSISTIQIGLSQAAAQR